MDGRRNNKGTKGNKGGRPPKSEESKLIERLDAIINQDEVLEVLHSKIQDGDARALELYFKYRHGLPKQKTEVTTDSEQPFILTLNSGAK